MSETAAAPPQPEQTNIKETIESILVAFILAFMFRAFIVEAFVIPTGSMAPTLLGAHLRYRCDDCGYEFEVNYQSPDSDGEDVSIPATARLTQQGRNADGSTSFDKVYRIHCPNCGYRMPRINPQDPANAATNPPVFYGDRILVLKYLYLLQEPRRWDVVVFKSPSSPRQFHYAQNYIKRLVGKPGESVMVLDGDIYVSPKSTAPAPADFVVQPKPRWAQEALWRVVYDNDFTPRGLQRRVTNASNQPVGLDPPFVIPWTAVAGESGWNLTEKRAFQFNNLSAAATLLFDADANTMPNSDFAPALTDWLAYDVTANQNGQGGHPDSYLLGGVRPDNNVSDVKLSAVYQRTAGDGPLRLTFDIKPGTPVGKTFIAELSRTEATLKMRSAGGGEIVVGSQKLSDDFSQPTQVELIHADYRVTLRIGGKDIVTTTPEQYASDVAFLLNNYASLSKLPKPQIAITADHQQARLTHVSLWRDVYYTNRTAVGGGQDDLTRTHQLTGAQLSWATPENFPAKVMRLGEDEYFVCGDNSLISGDGRYWTDPINLPGEDLQADAGRVPGRFLLGKAFFVYWPAGFRPLPNSAMPAIVPNFGKMRFIH